MPGAGGWGMSELRRRHSPNLIPNELVDENNQQSQSAEPDHERLGSRKELVHRNLPRTDPT